MNRIKQVRTELGLTQSEMGEYLGGVGKQCVSNYEHQLSQPPVTRLMLACRALRKEGHEILLTDFLDENLDKAV